MAGSSGGDDHNCSKNNAASSSHPLTEETATVKTIPFELIDEILLRLPVRSLLRFRCVCKSWNALISDPKFAKDQLRTSATDPTQLTRHHHLITCMDPSDDSLLVDYSLPSIFNGLGGATATWRQYPLSHEDRFHLLVGSCHGMLCLITNRLSAVLWNPSTGKFKTLPPLQTQFQLFFSATAYGFGYDSFGDSYKVVVVVSDLLRGAGGNVVGEAGGNVVYETEVKVHTLGTDSWRRIQGFPATPLNDDSGKFVSGTLNWLATDNTSLSGLMNWGLLNWFANVNNTSPSGVIVSLDLGTETYQQLLAPDYGDDVKVTMTLGVLKGCLCILAHCNLVSDVWLMKDYGNKESWTKLFSVPYVGDYVGHHPYYKRALCVSDGDDEILLELKSELVVYNSKSGTFKTIWGRPIVAEVYAESLISPC